MSDHAFDGPLPPGVRVGDVRDTAEREAEQLAAAIAGPGPRTAAPPAGGPLDPPTRSFFEQRLGARLGDVRVHTGERAAASARALGARAYAVGRDIVFGAGAYEPATAPGARLLAHELAHVVQQRAGPAVVRRQPEKVQVPGGEVTITPGAPRDLLGSGVLLPGNLRLASPLGLGGTPGFTVDIGPHGFLASLLGSIDLQVSPRPGARASDLSERGLKRIRLVDPVLKLDLDQPRLSGSAVLSIGSDYPPAVKPATDVDVRISSTDLREFSGTLGYGPLRGSFQLSLRYDTERLKRAAGASVLQRGLGPLGAEARETGFSLSGGLSLGPVPLTRFSAEAPHLRPRERSLLGAPAPFPLTASAGGVILAPPGAITSAAVPAFGYTRLSFGERSGTTFTAAALPTLSPTAISSGVGGPVRMFPVYLYTEITYVRQVGDGLDLGLSATLQIDTPTLSDILSSGPAPPYTPTAEPPTPNIGVRVFGRFSGP